MRLFYNEPNQATKADLAGAPVAESIIQVKPRHMNIFPNQNIEILVIEPVLAEIVDDSLG